MNTNIATLGHNGPPNPTSYEAATAQINDLYDEAKNWLDGETVSSQAIADNISALLNMIRAAEKEADEARKAEKKPHDDAGKAVQARYKPLLEKAAMASDACKKALAPWLAKLEAEKRAIAEAARREAEEKTKIAREAYQKAQADDLEARENAEALLKEAKAAEQAAARAEKDTAKAAGDGGRAVSLRSVFTPVLTDLNAAVRHYWITHKADFETLVVTLAERDVRAGERAIAGFEIKEERIAQ